MPKVFHWNIDVLHAYTPELVESDFWCIETMGEY
jgi:hypothetical protein